jgi:tRNA threonylcarbamoyladenosine biosynthesis protein TsaB
MTSRELFKADRLLEQSASIGPVLALDTGTAIANLGLVANGRVLAQMSRSSGPHGAQLPEAVARMLDHARVEIRDLAGVAVGIGPGSFTGLRIALSYAKGLVAASKCRIVGVGSLDAIALGALESAAAPEAAHVCAILDARKGEVYTALYRIVSDGLEKLSDDLVVKLECLVSRVPNRTVLAGDARAYEAHSLVVAQGKQAAVMAESEANPRGRFIAALGAARLASAQADTAALLEPLYVRPAEADLKAAGANHEERGTEGLWSKETSTSFNSLRPMTRS